MWVNDVMAPLQEVPTDVQNYNTIISQVLQDAESQAKTLVSQPSDGTALMGLNADLTILTSKFNLITTFISSAISNVQSFQGSMPALGQQLQSIAQKSAADAQADQQQIDKLNRDIAQLQNDIKSLTAAIIGLAIADGVAITIGVVTTIAFWPVGALAWFAMGPVVAAATTFIATPCRVTTPNCNSACLRTKCSKR